jgi:hypothetical protein
MLRLALECHPAICCFDEAVAYQRLSRNHATEVDAKKGVEMIGYKIPRFSEQLLWPSCSDPDYGEFSSFYRGEKVIFVVRNVLDTVSSMLTLPAGQGVSWLEHYGRSILSFMFERGLVCEQVHVFGNKYPIPSLPLHLVGALYWINKNAGLFPLVERSVPVMACSYEQIVKSPESNLRRICGFLEAGWNDEVLNHPRHQHGELDALGLAIGNTDPKRPIDETSVGRHSEIISDMASQEILSITAEIRAQLGEHICP